MGSGKTYLFKKKSNNDLYYFVILKLLNTYHYHYVTNPSVHSHGRE